MPKRPLKEFSLVFFLFCYFQLYNTAGIGLEDVSKGCGKKSVRFCEEFGEGWTSKPLNVLEPFTLKSALKNSNYIDYSLSETSDSSNFYFFPIRTSGNERYFSDLLFNQDQDYLKYLKLKLARSTTSGILDNFILDFSSGKVEKCVKLKGCSIWEAVNIIESPHFDGIEMDYLDDLPLIYMKRRLIEPFKAFLKRFKYKPISHIDLSNANSIKNKPFESLVLKFLEKGTIEDKSFDPFFKIILETQSEAFKTSEKFFFESWIRSPPSAWRFIKFYFDYGGNSCSKTISLMQALTSENYSGPVRRDLIKYLLKIKSFDINRKLDYKSKFISTTQSIPFVQVLVFQKRLSFAVLPGILSDPRLDLDFIEQTGQVTLSYKSFTLTYFNEPIVHLAAVMANFWGLLYLLKHREIFKVFRFDKFLIFLINHILKIICLFIFSIFREYYSSFRNCIYKFKSNK